MKIIKQLISKLKGELSSEAGTGVLMKRMSFKEFRQPKKKAKYNNKKTEVDGIIFDSRAEAIYNQQLKWLKQANQIKEFKLQPRFLLQEAFKKNGKTFRKIEYVADFEIHKLDGSIEIVDIKGTGKTKAAPWKVLGPETETSCK